MKIVHVVRQFYPAVGGLENVVLELAAAQASAGHAVKVVTLDRIFHQSTKERMSAGDLIRGIEVVRIPFFGSVRYPIAPSVLRHIRDGDLVHVHALDFFFDFLAWTRSLHRRPLVVSTHGGFFHTGFATNLKKIYFRTVTRRSLRSYGAVIAISSSDEERFRSIRPEGLLCIDNGVDTAKFYDTASPVPSKTIVVHGRWSSNKRLDRIITAIAELRKADREWKLIIAGRPWDLSAEDLKALCYAAGLVGAVTIIASPSDAELARLFQRSSLAASASAYEGFGIAAVEGMSAGLVPILSDIPAHRNLVSNSAVGVLTDFGDAGKAARAIRDAFDALCSDFANTRAKLIDACRRYSWNEACRAYERIYSIVLGIESRIILGVPVRVNTFTDAVRHLDQLFDEGAPQIVAFANANCLNLACHDRELALSLRRAVVLNDGIGLDIASRILFHTPFPTNLNGTDFVPGYLQATRHLYRIYLMGAGPEVIDRAADAFRRDYTRHSIVGYRNGFFDEIDEPAIIDEIRRSAADILLVGMGNPKQEKWLAEHLSETGCKLGFAVGALFDFVSEEVPRAPLWLRQLRLEWLYRMWREPRRLFLRYVLGNPKFLASVLQQWWHGARV